VLTNRASGRTGRAVARGIYVSGGTVTLLHDGGSLPYATVKSVETAAEMTEAAVAETAEADALVSAAAISDYTVDPAPEKLASGEPRTLELSPTPKLVDAVRDARPNLPIVGFKLESDPGTLPDSARALSKRVGMAFVVANETDAMGGAKTTAQFVFEDETRAFEGSKDELGLQVAAELASVLRSDEQAE
jgi:phosphopantothenoylcysteine decarboxylase/phosphopantothenate--cysteine ligase